MASDSRALTLKLLADTADFQKKLESGSKDIDSIGERAAEFGKKAALAFAVAGAAIGAFAVSAVKAAAEDELAQKKLAETIAATTEATTAQIAGVEKYITQTSIAIGITDDELRPAFSRLVRSTKDVSEAQNLLNLALDLSAATGKPLETVANALGKAYDGNTSALGKLGLGIDATTLKSQSFDTTFQQLTSTFGNFAENEALSTQVQMERVKIALDEAKESIGAALLPVVQELTAWILNNFIPALNAFIGGLTGQKGLNSALTDSQKTAQIWGEKVRGFIDTIIRLKDQILILGVTLAAVFTVNKIAAAIAATITLIKGLITAYNALKSSAIVAGVAAAFALNPLLGIGAVALAAAVLSGANALANRYDTSTTDTGLTYNQQREIDIAGRSSNTNLTTGDLSGITGLTGGGGGGGGGGAGSGSGAGGSTGAKTLIEQVTEENFIKNMAPGNFDPGRFRQRDEALVNITVNGAIDPASTARQIADLLNNEAAVAGTFNNLGVSRFATRAE